MDKNMADYRPIKTKVWHDNWFITLNPNEKLLWMFLLTNEYVHISGLYELPKPLIIPLTGIKDYEEILNKFIKDKKILYKNDWIYIINYFKNQSKQINKKDNVYKSRDNYFKENRLILDKLGLNNEAPYKPLKAPCGTLPKDFKDFKDFKDIKDISEQSPPSSILEECLKTKNFEPYFISNKGKEGKNHIWIIWLYAHFKEIDKTWENAKQVRSFIKRNLRPAVFLDGYSDGEILKTFKYMDTIKIKNQWMSWALETSHKYISGEL